MSLEKRLPSHSTQTQPPIGLWDSEKSFWEKIGGGSGAGGGGGRMARYLNLTLNK